VARLAPDAQSKDAAALVAAALAHDDPQVVAGGAGPRAAHGGLVGGPRRVGTTQGAAGAASPAGVKVTTTEQSAPRAGWLRRCALAWVRPAGERERGGQRPVHRGGRLRARFRT
jgi:hypothetical protein